MIINPTTEQIDELIGSQKTVLIDFYADWCSPCKMLSPIFDRVSGAREADVCFVKINIDERPELAERYEVLTVPTIVAISSGEVKHTSTGIMNEPSMLALLDKLA